MRKGFTLIEVLVASLMLGVALSAILVAMSQSQKMMLSSTDLQVAQEVMDIAEMAYPLDGTIDPDDAKRGLTIQEQSVEDLWQEIQNISSDIPDFTNAQEDRYYGYRWSREEIDPDNSELIDQLQGIRRVKVTVTWDDDRRGNKKSESYVALWRPKDDG
jgi:prepilin-type N-terminal cleavage/methylation domain-containing protein